MYCSHSARRSFLAASFAVAAAPLMAQNARPIKIIVPFAPGGGNDVFARQMAKGLGELRNQSVIVENRPGAGGNIGTEQVVRSLPDGNTLLLGHSGTISINPSSASSIKTMADVVAVARSRPGALNYASSGSGAGGHLTGELLEQMGGLKITHVPYKGTAPALTDLAGGQVQMMFSVIPPALALVKSGRLRAVAVTGSKRLPSLADVPTVAESGIAGLTSFESSLTYGILAPLHTPDAIVSELSRQIIKVATAAEFQSRLEADGAVLLIGGSADYAALIRRESAGWAAIVKASGATAE
jgi:tripartite-type tricarboxylate transporter receptor subunit TctC